MIFEERYKKERKVNMLKKAKAIILVLCLTVMTLACASCGSDGEKKEKIYFLNFKPEAADVYGEIAKKYEEETGVKVKVVTAAANTYEQTLKSEVAKSNAPTIFQMNGPVGYESWKDYCADMKDSKLYSYLTDKNLAVTRDGGVYGIPFVVEGYGIIYNDAIMRKYFALPDKAVNITSAAEITDFETLKKVAEDMTKNKEKLGISGVFGSTSLATGQDWRWQTHLSNVTFFREFTDKSDGDAATTAVNSKEIKFSYSDNFKKIFDLYINNSATDKKLLGSKSVADSMAEFALGKVAMIQNGTWSWSQISDVSGNTVKEDDIKFLPIYMDLDGEKTQGLCVGTENYIAVNAKVSEEKQKASFDFLDWLYSSETGKKYVYEKLGFITPFNTFSEDEAPDDPLSKQLKSWLSKDNIKSVPWIFVGYPNEKFKTDFGNALLEYVQGSLNWDGVVKKVTDSWKEERK